MAHPKLEEARQRIMRGEVLGDEEYIEMLKLLQAEAPKPKRASSAKKEALQEFGASIGLKIT